MTKPILTVIGQPGLHSNFLRYILDFSSELMPEINVLPFNYTGTSHEDVPYSGLFEIISHRDVEPSDIGPFVCLEGDDLLYFHRASLGREGDKDNDLTKSENFANWHDWNSHHVREIKNNYNIEKDAIIPKFILRDSFKKGFLDIERNGMYLFNKQRIKSCSSSSSNKPYLFPVSSFFSEKSFIQQCTDLDLKHNLRLNLNKVPEIYKMFYERNKILQTHNIVQEILDAVRKKTQIQIPKLDVIQEAYIYAKLEKENDFITMPLTEAFFQSTGDIISYLKYFPEHYKAINPNLPTFNGYPNPYYLAKLKK